MLELIKSLSLLDGISGREDSVRNFIIDEIKEYADDITVDSLGSLIVFKKGKKSSAKKIMLDAHMDEVGMLISTINSDGTLGFEAVGGIDERVMLGRPVKIGNKSISGVIGLKPVHLISPEKTRDIPDEMYIDIGSSSKEETEKIISLGEYAVFDSDFVEFGDGLIKGKALDDRAGCAILIEMIKSDLPYDLYFTFTVAEEVGFGSASTAAYSVNPDYAIIVEATTAADLPDVPESKRICSLGEGAAISFMDRRTVYPKKLYDKAFETARKNNIKAQPKSAVTGGNNAGVIHKAGNGVETIAISIPCRYLHSPSCVLNLKDVDEVLKLVSKLSEELAND